jgi:hypothetical protein
VVETPAKLTPTHEEVVAYLRGLHVSDRGFRTTLREDVDYERAAAWLLATLLRIREASTPLEQPPEWETDPVRDFGHGTL